VQSVSPDKRSSGLESKKIGHGGDSLLSQITGMDVETIRRGRRELEEDLPTRPTDRIRLEGVGDRELKKDPQLPGCISQTRGGRNRWRSNE